MDPLDKIKKALEDRNLKKVARATGLAYNVVWRIAKGETTNPSYESVRALSAYLKQNP